MPGGKEPNIRPKRPSQALDHTLVGSLQKYFESTLSKQNNPDLCMINDAATVAMLPDGSPAIWPVQAATNRLPRSSVQHVAQSTLFRRQQTHTDAWRDRCCESTHEHLTRT